MKSKDRIVARDNGITCVLDLQDFPHGELVGVRKDGEYDIEFYSVPPSLEVPSYNPATGKIEWKQVACWSIHRGKKTEIVTLTDGSQIYTDNDPRAIYGIASDAETLEPCRFTPTDAQKRRVLVPVTSESFVANPPLTWYDFDTGLMGSHRTEHSVDLGFSFGQFIGVIAGDGWGAWNEVHLSDSGGYNIKFVSDFLKTIYGNFYSTEYVQKKDTDSSRYGDTKKYRLNVGTAKFCDRIKELVDGHGDEHTSGSANKRLPIWYQFCGMDFIEGLVCGMIATDGTVAVSYGKDKPQLRIQFSSTSLRLAREFQRCCRLLGVRASVFFSKRTVGGNDAWNVTVSTIDAKNVGLLDKCCHERKRDIFKTTDVMLDPVHAKNDIVPFPSSASRELVALVPYIAEPKSDDEMRQNAVCIGVRKYEKSGHITRAIVRKLYTLGVKLAKDNEDARIECDNAYSGIWNRLQENLPSSGSLRTLSVDVSQDDAERLRIGIEASKSRLTGHKEASAILKMLYLVRKRGKMYHSQAVALGRFLSTVKPQTELRDSHTLKTLLGMADSDVRWEYIDFIDRTNVEQIGFDLTVPGYDTFVNADGVVLSNTVNIHVPASEKASKEALEKMLPSKNLLSLTDLQSVRYKPEKEQVSGLWALTSGKSGRAVKVFDTKSEAIRAYRNGEIGANDPVEIRKKA